MDRAGDSSTRTVECMPAAAAIVKVGSLTQQGMLALSCGAAGRPQGPLPRRMAETRVIGGCGLATDASRTPRRSNKNTQASVFADALRVAEVQTFFEHFDKDKEGTITYDEFTQTLRGEMPQFAASLAFMNQYRGPRLSGGGGAIADAAQCAVGGGGGAA